MWRNDQNIGREHELFGCVTSHGKFRQALSKLCTCLSLFVSKGPRFIQDASPFFFQTTMNVLLPRNLCATIWGFYELTVIRLFPDIPWRILSFDAWHLGPRLSIIDLGSIVSGHKKTELPSSNACVTVSSP